MRKFILIRHGKAEMQGEDHLRKLDEDGLIQSKSLCEKLIKMLSKKVRIHSSPFVRAVNTIKPLAERLGKKVIECDELKEIETGKSEKYTKHEIIKKMWEDENFKTNNGVSQLENYKKIEPFISSLFNDSTDEDMVIVTHGNLLGIILKNYFKKEFGFDDWKIMSMPDLYELNFENNKLVSFKRDIKNIEKIFYID